MDLTTFSHGVIATGLVFIAAAFVMAWGRTR